MIVVALTGGIMYIAHLQEQVKTLQSAQQEAVDVSKRDAATLQQAMSDFTRQAQILASERDKAIKQTKALADRYHQIMETQNAAVIDPILCASLVRVYEQHSSPDRANLSMSHTASVAQSSILAQSACKDITQKDIAAWIETSVYPAFKNQQQQLTDLGNYVSR